MPPPSQKLEKWPKLLGRGKHPNLDDVAATVVPHNKETPKQQAACRSQASTVELHGLGLTEWHLHLKMVWFIWPYTNSYLPFRGGDHQLTPYGGLAAVETGGIYVHPNFEIWNSPVVGKGEDIDKLRLDITTMI